jgi:hypothetical protein
MCWIGGFFFAISWGLAILHKENLAKFGYKSEKKVETFWNPTMYWRRAGTYSLNTADLLKTFLEMWRIWGNFFSRKSLRRKSQALFFCRQVTNFAKNKNTVVEAACPLCTVAYDRTKVANTLKVPQTRPAVSHHCEGQWSRSCSTHFGRFLTRESYPVQSKAKRKASSACRHASSMRAKCS